MGISILWSVYQMIPPFLLLLHRCMRIRHEVKANSFCGKPQRLLHVRKCS